MRTSRCLLSIGSLLLLLLAPRAALARTFYVDAELGSDAATTAAAQNVATPWQTIRKALGTALPGDTIVVQPGQYLESVQSKRDGLADAPITLQSAVAGGAVIQPPSGSVGVLIYHHWHVVDGFAITGASVGIKVGPHLSNSGEAIAGILVQNSAVYGNSSNGIQFNSGQGGEIAFNSVSQNGGAGIKYDGNAASIHQNVVHDNLQIGIYVTSGVDHQVYLNQAYANTPADVKILGTLLAVQRTYYVDPLNGSNAYTADQAQSPATAWQTVKTAIAVAMPGDAIVLLPGVYAESVESKRDGTAASPITIRAQKPGTAIIQPPAGTNGIYVSHHYHTIDGLVVTGGLNGIQLGPHDGAQQSIYGMVASNNVLYGNAAVGIKLYNAAGGIAMYNVVYGNGQEGILYGTNSANGVAWAQDGVIFNNLVYGNGLGNQGKFGIALGGGSGHRVTNNTLYGNVSGGIQLGQSSSLPVTATVLNNIVGANGAASNNGAGISERSAGNYAGQVVLDYNDVYGNMDANGRIVNYVLNVSTAGASSISVPAGFVDPADGNFKLGRVAAGQPANSPCIDRGSDTASALGLDGRTAFTDKSPDTGRVDLGYHGTALRPSTGTLTVSQVLMHLNPAAAGDDFFVTVTLDPGPDSDGIEVGVNFAEMGLGGLVFPMPVAGFKQQGGQWSYAGQSGGITAAAFSKLANGGITASLQGAGLNLLFNDAPVTVQLRIGDDLGSATVPLRGTLLYP